MKHWKDRKRILSVLMLVAMIITSLPASFVSALAETDTTVYGVFDMEAFSAGKVKDDDDEGDEQPSGEVNTFVVQAVARTDGALAGGSIVGESAFTVAEGESCTIEYQADAGYAIKEAFALNNDSGERTELVLSADSSCTLFSVSANATVFLVFGEVELINVIVMNGRLNENGVQKDANDPNSYQISYSNDDPALYSFKGVEVTYADGSVVQLDDATEEGARVQGVTGFTQVVVSFEQPKAEYQLIGHFPKLAEDGEGYDEEVLLSDEVRTGTEVSLNSEDYEREGFTLLVDDPRTVLEGTVTAQDGLTLHAYYERNTYKLSFSISSESEEHAGDIISLQDVEFGATVTVEDYPETDVEEVEFAGWLSPMSALPSTPDATFSMPAVSLAYEGIYLMAGAPQKVSICLDGTAMQGGTQNKKGEITVPFPAGGELSLDPINWVLACGFDDKKPMEIVSITGIVIELYKAGEDDPFATSANPGYAMVDFNQRYEIMLNGTVLQNAEITVSYTDDDGNKTTATYTAEDIIAQCTIAQPLSFEYPINDLPDDFKKEIIAMYDGNVHLFESRPELSYKYGNGDTWIAEADFKKSAEAVNFTNVTTTSNGQGSEIVTAETIMIQYFDESVPCYYEGKGTVLIYHRPVQIRPARHVKDFDDKPYADTGIYTVLATDVMAELFACDVHPTTPTYHEWVSMGDFEEYQDRVAADWWADVLNNYETTVYPQKAQSTEKPLLNADIRSSQISSQSLVKAPGEYKDLLPEGVSFTGSAAANHFAIPLLGILEITPEEKEFYEPDPDPTDPEDPTDPTDPTDPKYPIPLPGNFGTTDLVVIYDGDPVTAESSDLVRWKNEAEAGTTYQFTLREITVDSTSANYYQNIEESDWYRKIDDFSFVEVGTYCVYIKAENANGTYLGVAKVKIVPRPIIVTVNDQEMEWTGNTFVDRMSSAEDRVKIELDAAKINAYIKAYGNALQHRQPNKVLCDTLHSVGEVTSVNGETDVSYDYGYKNELETKDGITVLGNGLENYDVKYVNGTLRIYGRISYYTNYPINGKKNIQQMDETKYYKGQLLLWGIEDVDGAENPIDGYVFNGWSKDSATATAENTYKAGAPILMDTKSIVMYAQWREAKTVTIIVEHVNNKTKERMPGDDSYKVIVGVEGDDFLELANDYEGFTPNVPYIKGTFDEETKTITFYYDEDEDPEVKETWLLVRHVDDETGVDIAAIEVHTVAIGSSYTANSILITGYTPVAPTSVTADDIQGPRVLVLRYAKNGTPLYELKVRYLEKGTNIELISPTTHGNYKAGDIYFKAAEAITGYKPVDPAYVVGEMPVGGVTREIYYESTAAQYYTLTVYHRSTSTGAIIATTDVLTVAVGNTYRVNSKSISGYTVVGDGYVAGTMPAQNVEHTIWYNKNSTGGSVTPTTVPTTNPTAAPTSTTSGGSGGLTIYPSTSQNPGTSPSRAPSTGDNLTNIDDAAVPLGNITSPNVGECFE